MPRRTASPPVFALCCLALVSSLATGRAAQADAARVAVPSAQPPGDPQAQARRTASALLNGRWITAIDEAGDDPALSALAALFAARTGAGPIIEEGAFDASMAERLETAYERGDPPSAVWSARLASGEENDEADIRAVAERLARAATVGRADAAYLLADLIQTIGRPEDRPRALELLRSAAEAGFEDAQYRLGLMHRLGEGVPADEARAASLIGAAARSGMPQAQSDYGLMLFNGVGVPEDRSAAADFIRRAALQGEPVAQNRLARLYARGLGVATDPFLAVFWHLLARDGDETRDGISDPVLDGYLAGVEAEVLQAARRAASDFRPSPGPRDAASLLAVLGWPRPL